MPHLLINLEKQIQKCPKCQKEDTKIIGKRWTHKGKEIWERYGCKNYQYGCEYNEKRLN